MDGLNPLLKYFLATSAATAMGLLYWMAVANLEKYKMKFVLALLLSLLLTPAGAWIVSLILKARQLSKEIQRMNASAS
jgi:NhaP-type Na+/H+ or K+/H+ antiporter